MKTSVNQHIRKLSVSLIAASCFIAAPALAASLKIGIIAPLSGGAAEWGLATTEGPRILANEINKKGGLDIGGTKHQIEIIAYDDQYKTAEAIAAYNRLVNQDKVKFVIIFSSPSTMALKQKLEDDKILGFSSANTSKALDKDTKYMFRLLNTPDQYISGFVSWMAKNLEGKRIATLNPNDETGWDLKQLSEPLYKENGYEIVAGDLFERTQKDFQPMLTKVLAAKPDIIDLGAAAPATAGLLVRQARELGYEKVFVKTGAGAPKEIVSAAGPAAAEGAINVLFADPENEAYQRLAATYQKTQGHEPNQLLVAFYDGANVLFSAIQKAGTIEDTTAVAAAVAEVLPMKALQGGDLTLSGQSKYGSNTQILSVNYIGSIRDGEPVVVGTTQ